jgi:hypothetical protein
MSWLYSQALVAAYSAANCSAGAPSAPSNGMPTPLLYCALDRMKEFSRLSRFGMTCRPSTDVPGADVLTWFLAGFPVRTSAPLAKALESTASAAECGDTWLGSLARYDHVSRSWKTHQCSFLEGLDEFSETWPRWGMMRDGACWAQSTRERRTSETESGLLPTPTKSDGTGGPARSEYRKGGDNLRTAVQQWPTPRAGNPGSRPNGKGGKILAEEVKKSVIWPTPTVCGNYNRKGASATSGDGLATAVKTWPTPTACMSKGSSQAALVRKDGQSRAKDRLDHAMMAANGGSLNPTWVEWLMGWPLGWTDCAASVTDKFQQWRLSHGECCRKDEVES